MEIFLIIVGLVMIYSWVHFAVIQHKKAYKARTGYEQAVTWVAIVGLVLFIIGNL